MDVIDAAPENHGVERQPISERFAHYLPTAATRPGPDQSDSDMIARMDEPTSADEKTLISKGLDASGRLESATVINAPRRTRTYNPLIKSQRAA